MLLFPLNKLSIQLLSLLNMFVLTCEYLLYNTFYLYMYLTNLKHSNRNLTPSEHSFIVFNILKPLPSLSSGPSVYVSPQISVGRAGTSSPLLSLAQHSPCSVPLLPPAHTTSLFQLALSIQEIPHPKIQQSV